MTIAHAPNSSLNCSSQLMAQMDIWLTCSPLTLHHFSLKVSQTWHNLSEIRGYMIGFSSDTCHKFLQQIAYLVQKWRSVLHWQTRLTLGTSVYFCLLLHWTRSWCSLVSGSRSVTKSSNLGIQKAHVNFWNPLALQNWKEKYLKRQVCVCGYYMRRTLEEGNCCFHL